MKEVVFTIRKNEYRYDISTKNFLFAHLNCADVLPSRLYANMLRISDVVGKDNFGCLFELD